MDRRKFMAQALGTGAAVSVLSQSAEGASDEPIKVVGVACSTRRGKTTAQSVGIALEAAESVDSRVDTVLLDLGGRDVPGWPGGAKPSDGIAKLKKMDDYLNNAVLPELKDPALGGLIIGSPSYFRSMSSLCKAFLERIALLRSPKLLLADKPLGALSVGAFRNGGQELVVDQIQTAMLCHEVMIVGGKPRAHQGATLWNKSEYNDDIKKDEFGVETARDLGVRVAEAALRLDKE